MLARDAYATQQAQKQRKMMISMTQGGKRPLQGMKLHTVDSDGEDGVRRQRTREFKVSVSL